MTTYRSTKTYGHEVGLSACFRQWRAESHCSKLHGYALAVSIEFEARELDETGWVMDFGALKPIKQYLVELFDHKLLIACDDPAYAQFVILEREGLAQVRFMGGGVGCEAFAAHILGYVQGWLITEGHDPRVRVAQVEVREHGANSAIAIADVEAARDDEIAGQASLFDPARFVQRPLAPADDLPGCPF